MVDYRALFKKRRQEKGLTQVKFHNVTEKI